VLKPLVKNFEMYSDFMKKNGRSSEELVYTLFSQVYDEGESDIKEYFPKYLTDLHAS
jgi:hypothetical protein